MTNINEQFAKIAAIQAEATEPFKAFGSLAAETFEKLARQNYAVLGDYVEFAVAQAKLPGQVKDGNDYVGRQIESTRSFGETIAARFQEFATIARTAQDQAQEATTPKTASKTTAKKAA
jgi:hypothetical protein